ncbi:MAG: CBS domain-containing protein [Zetaproteobacteria bacterium]|nr:MAG: CBS domain-containing protein [Zetaproteobacteria bacterium]
MFAWKIMTSKVITCRPDQPVGEVIDLMIRRHLHTVPVVEEDGTLRGSINTLSILNRVVPEYIVTGDLKSVPFAPDIGLLRKHFRALACGDKVAADIMERKPTTVRDNESLLSVTAALITYDRYEYVLVVDRNRKLLGVISSGDILRALHQGEPEGIEQA